MVQRLCGRKECGSVYRITQLKVPLNYDEAELPSKIAAYLKVPEKSILSWRYHKKSVDARKKDRVGFVLSVDVELKPGTKCKTESVKVEKYVFPTALQQMNNKRPIVVGSGPAGLFAALTLAHAGLKPIVLERGRQVEQRIQDVESFMKTGILQPESNIQFGEGGAGTFSDGKLTTGTKDIRIQAVLQEFYEAGAAESILYDAKPHIGTDVLRRILVNLRQKIIGLGGEFLFETKLTDIVVECGHVVGIKVQKRDGTTVELPADNLILAVGHSARDTFEMLLKKGFSMCQKPFAMGFRVEHLQSFMNESQYGVFANHPALGAADYKLFTHLKNGRGVYTFCMCPGGYVVPAASEEGMLCVNGMSTYARDGKNANSAVLVSVVPEDLQSEHPLAGVALQRQVEKRAYELGGGGYVAPVQLVEDFLAGRKTTALNEVEPTYSIGTAFADLSSIFPNIMTEALREGLVNMNSMIAGFTKQGAVLTGAEARSSSPVRIIRDAVTMQSNIAGVYPCGEGAGYAGGIMTAAVDGIKAAEAVVKMSKI